MQERTQQRIAAALALVALAGFVAAPLLHAEAHLHEAAAAREAALARAFDLAFRAPAQQGELGRALEEALSGRAPAHGHSHGPGPHGTGSLEHLDKALHGPPPPPAPLPLQAVPLTTLFAAVTAARTPRYTTPERSQAPPPRA